MSEPTKQLLLHLPASLIKRLSDAAELYNYRTGNQVAADVLENCLGIWEQGEQAKLDVFKQYLPPSVQGVQVTSIDNARDGQHSNTNAQTIGSTPKSAPPVSTVKRPSEKNTSVHRSASDRIPRGASRNTSAIRKRVK
jgi:hypothetical protein